MSKIKYGDWIIFRNQHGKEWLRRITEGKSLHTHRGFISFDTIVGKPNGSIVKIMNDKLLLMFPKPAQLARNMAHKTNIIYETDAVAMLSSAGVGPGDKVLEIGTGSGGLTLFLARYITMNNSEGQIISIDLRESHSETAKANLVKFNLMKPNQIEFKVGEINEVISKENYFDAVFMDMSAPWELLEQVVKTVKSGNSIMIFLPNWYQVEQVIDKAKVLKITVLDVFESNKRPMDVNPSKHIMRPKFKSFIYSGIIIHLLKTVEIET